MEIKLRWFSHVMRKDDSRTLRMALEGNGEGKRERERQK